MSRGHLAAVCCLLFTLIGVSQPASAACAVRDLGPFSMCVPEGWRLTEGGIDSAAGTFRAGKLSVRYDFGLYSEPLAVPPGATEASATQVLIDGLPGRSVVYATHASHVAGLHLPGVRSTSMGMVKLTIVAESASRLGLQEAETAFRSIRIRR